MFGTEKKSKFQKPVGSIVALSQQTDFWYLNVMTKERNKVGYGHYTVAKAPGENPGSSRENEGSEHHKYGLGNEFIKITL